MNPFDNTEDSYQDCPLCFSRSKLFFIDQKRRLRYFLCDLCDLRFLDANQRLNAEQEFNRYQQHNNCVTDLRYQKFVEPLYLYLKKRIRLESKGLDYGCGSGPVLSYLLKKDGYDISLYDPYFYPDVENLKKSYDFIFSIEVAEHFYHPASEFLKFKNRLKTNGVLSIMTLLYDERVDFSSWFYRMDPTHVCFYSLKTFHWILDYFAFGAIEYPDKRLICLQNKSSS